MNMMEPIVANTNNLGFQRAAWRERIYELGTLPNRVTAMLVIPNAGRNLENTTLARLDKLERELAQMAARARCEARWDAP